MTDKNASHAESTLSPAVVPAAPPSRSIGMAAEPSAIRTLLDEVLEQGVRSAVEASESAPSESPLVRFLTAGTVGAALEQWSSDFRRLDKDEIARNLNSDIARIDAIVERQLNAILHHPAFQRLESAYRGIKYLVSCQTAANAGSLVKIKILNWPWRDLVRDLDRASEFDQSQLFRKVYENEFGTAGGEPFGALIGDYEIHPRPSEEHPTDDIAALTGLSQIAAAAFCPLITGVHPSMFGLNSYAGLERVENLERGFDQPEFIKWRAFRESEDTRFVGLTLPRVLMRRPYENDTLTPNGFCFNEDVSGADREGYLWGNAAFAMGEVLIRTFANFGWLSEIRGVTRNAEVGGLVTRLPVHHFGTDSPGVAPKTSTETVITESQEARLNALGFMSLCHCYDTEYSAFYTCPSAQKPKVYDREAATQNAKISSMLHYMFCVSRFAHYLKILARDQIGSFVEADETAKTLRQWLMQYVTPDDSASIEIKARRPLRDADVQVVPEPGKPGQYLCTFRLSPHYQFDNINASIQLRTRVSSRGVNQS
jgi:type VI secretion system ImpC/EvpB family protein